MRFSYSQHEKVLLYICAPGVYNVIINAETEVVKMDFITSRRGIMSGRTRPWNGRSRPEK